MGTLILQWLIPHISVGQNAGGTTVVELAKSACAVTTLYPLCGRYQKKHILMNCDECPSIILCGAAIILITILHMAELFGINVIKAQVFLIAKSQQQIYLKVYACFAICGVECYRVKAFQMVI